VILRLLLFFEATTVLPADGPPRSSKDRWGSDS
jgi:hypothetical protein